MHFGKSFVLYIFYLSIQWCTSGQILATTFEMTSGKPPNVLFFFKYIKSLTDLSIALVFIFFLLLVLAGGHGNNISFQWLL